ncbi:MAG: hypothetical protein IJJ43_05225 [Oscillospiraceae bacterium]|nr:hypothetical protein [Oscillospiraceae bacterium]
MRKILEFIPHLTLVLALGLALFTILDGYNPFMEWLTSGVSKLYIYLFCALSAATAVLCAAEQRRK